MNSSSDMGLSEELRLPDWLKRIFFNVVFLGRRFDQKTVAVLDPLDGHQVLNCKCRGYKDNRKPISVQFKSLLLLGSCPCCIPATLSPHPPLPHHHPFSLILG